MHNCVSGYLLLLFFTGTQQKCKDDNTCVQTKTHGMRSADCFDKNFKKFPLCLRSDIEVIDLTYNRLRRITRDELRRYKSLKMLYLSDNLITKLDNSTFQDMSQLESLDLSLNAIPKLPPVVFRLPSLRRLYLSQNLNTNIVDSVEEAKPISSPLEAIDIAFNELESLPDFGVMPHLRLYNVTGNNVKMQVKHVAGMCNLQLFSNNNFTAFFENVCDCWNVQMWLRERKVRFTKINCDIAEYECPYSISEEDMETYKACKAIYWHYNFKSILVKIGLGIGVIIFVVLLLISYCCYRRRRQRRNRQRKNNQINVLNGKSKDHEGLL